MDPQVTAALTALAVAVIGLIGEALRRWGAKLFKKLDENTAETTAAKEAAQAAADQANWRQKATVLTWERDELRRKVSLIEGVPACLHCRNEIARILAEAPTPRRVSDPPTPTQERPA